jgi:DNA gyrase subunit B
MGRDNSGRLSFQDHQASIQEALAPVRKRPGMYIGSVDARGIQHMVELVIDNSITEVSVGACNRIVITIAEEDIISVEDNGRGIPITFDPETGLSSLDRILGLLPAGEPTALSQRHKVIGIWHGVGLAAVNALTDWLEVETWRDGRRYFQEYLQGVPRAPVSVAEDSTGSGTRIRFRPNRQILHGDLRYELLDERVRELAYLNSGLQITLRDDQPGQRQEHRCCFADGIAAFVRYEGRHRWSVTPQPPIQVAGAFEHGKIEAALQYSTSSYDSEQIVRSYANYHETTRGGTHVAAFRAALRRALTTVGRTAGLMSAERAPLSNAEVSRGLTAVISVHLDQPQYDDNMVSHLDNPEIQADVERLVMGQILTFLTSEPTSAREILTQCLTAPTAR